jgi:hypothetical protein
VTNGQVDKIDRFFAEVRKVLTNGSFTNEEKKQKAKLMLEETILDRLSQDDLTAIHLKTREIVSSILKKGVRKSELNEKRESVERLFVTTFFGKNSQDNNSRSIVRGWPKNKCAQRIL